MIKNISLIIMGYDIDVKNGDIAVLVVGKQNGPKLDIINTIIGKEASDLYNKLCPDKK